MRACVESKRLVISPVRDDDAVIANVVHNDNENEVTDANDAVNDVLALANNFVAFLCPEIFRKKKKKFSNENDD